MGAAPAGSQPLDLRPQAPETGNSAKAANSIADFIDGKRVRELALDADFSRPPELTIDDGMQEILECELDLAWERYRAQAVIAVLVDPRTGEILAMGDRARLESGGLAQNAGLAASFVFEPGHLFSPVSIAAALNPKNRC